MYFLPALVLVAVRLFLSMLALPRPLGKACKPGTKGQQRLQPLQTQCVFKECNKGRIGRSSSSAPFFVGHQSPVVCFAGGEVVCFQVVLLGGSSSPADPLASPSLACPAAVLQGTG